jgi:hypothetical protein
VPVALRDWGRRALPSLPPLSPRLRAAVLALVGVGAVLRILWALKAQEPVELRDPVLYLILGDQLAEGNGYTYGFGVDQGTTAYYPPGYPLVLGAVVWLVRLLPGEAAVFDVAIWLNVALSVATIGLVFLLGRRLAGDRVGLVAAGAWALWPNLVFHSGVVLTETLFLFLLVLMLIVLLGDPGAARLPGRARLVTVGVLFGLTLLVRPVSAVIAPVFLILWWGAGVRAALWRLALVGVATVAVLVPWSIRSSLAMDEPVAMSLNFGDNLCIGHNPGADGGFGDLGAHCYAAEELRRPEAETRRNSENIDRAVTYITENPGTTLRRTVSKARITLQDDHDGFGASEDYGRAPLMSAANRDRFRLLADVYYYAVGVAAVAGGVVLLRRPDPARRGLFLVVAGAAQLVSPLATFGDPRFKMPIYPTVAVCAAVALVAVWERWAPGRPGAGTTPAPASAASGDADGDGGAPGEGATDRPATPSPA